MLILGVDTSGQNGSVALVEFEQGSARTLEVVPLEGGAFSAQLIPQIADLLKRHKRTKADIDGFAVVSGPGSFTGLRVGLAAIKALAEVLGKPIAAISLLEAIVRASGKMGEFTAVLDAGRGEVYLGNFSIVNGRAKVGEQSLPKLAELSPSNGQDIITPDAKIADLLRSHGLRVHQISYPKSDFIAALGFEKMRNEEIVSSIDLDANYIRRSDAEMKKSTIQ